MSRGMKIRSRLTDGEADVLALIHHPMENGLRTDKQTGARVPAHFIETVTVAHNGRTVATMAMGGGVSRDPLLGFRIPGARTGDRVRVSWRDNRGESGSAETTVGD